MTVDPWLVTKYDSSATGVASLSLDVEDFSLTGTNPVAGRTVVFHDSAGTRIGCGVLVATSGEVVDLASYPEYTGTYKDTIVGTVVVAETSVGITIDGTIGGVEASATAGIHIHSGFTCDVTADNTGASTVGTSVGGHFYGESESGSNQHQQQSVSFAPQPAQN